MWWWDGLGNGREERRSIFIFKLKLNGFGGGGVFFYFFGGKLLTLN